MLTPMKPAIAAALMLGLFPAVPEAADSGKATQRRTGHADMRTARPIAPGTSIRRAPATPTEHANRPAYAPANECWNDEGGFRWRPCGGGDSGGGGGGGGM